MNAREALFLGDMALTATLLSSTRRSARPGARTTPNLPRASPTGQYALASARVPSNLKQ